MLGYKTGKRKKSSALSKQGRIKRNFSGVCAETSTVQHIHKKTGNGWIVEQKNLLVTAPLPVKLQTDCTKS